MNFSISARTKLVARAGAVHVAGEAPIKQLCRVLQVSRLGYCAARQRASRAPVACSESVHARAAFEASGST